MPKIPNDIDFNMMHFRYRGALLSLLSHVVNTIQFKYNQAKLEELDDETMDSDVGAADFFMTN